MKKIFIQIILFVAHCNLFAQYSPDAYLLFKDGKTIPKINSSNPVSNSIGDIITIGDTVWLGTSRGVSVSFDRGLSWTNFYETGPFGKDNISAVGYNNGVVWVATAINKEVPLIGMVPEGTGLKYTTDNGLTWSAIPQPVDDLDDTTEVYGINVLRALPITATELNLTYDFAFTPGTVWITSWGSGTRKSTDLGQTWKRVVLPPDYLDSIHPDDTLNFCLSPKAGSYCNEENFNHVSFSVISIDDTTLYVGTANGINKSTDNGISWVKFNHQNQTEPISGNFVNALRYNYSSNTIWASTWKANDVSEFWAVSSSTDRGESWKIFLEDERPHNFGFKDSDVIVATDNGAFRSSNQGNSWILPINIFDKETGVTLTTSEFFSAASDGNDVWLGSGDGLARLRETSFWQGEWKIYLAGQSLTSEQQTYCYPNPYSPKHEQLKIKYSTAGRSATVTIKIFDFGMNYIRTVIQNAPRNKSVESPPDYWDGRDDNGNLLPNGVYLYRVDVDSNTPLFGKIIYLQ